MSATHPIISDDRHGSTEPVSRRPTPFTTAIDLDVQARVRRLALQISGSTGARYSIARLVEDALRRYCDELEGRYVQPGGERLGRPDVAGDKDPTAV
jgi:hypothetical protein